MEPITIAFITAICFLNVIVMIFQNKNDTFDIRDIICSWDAKSKKQIVSTDKTLLAGAFLTSSYVVIHNYSEVALAAYLAAWVTNGGIASYHKLKAKNASQP